MAAQKFDVVEDIHAAIRVDPAVTQSLLKQEQRSKVRVEKEEQKHRQLSEEVSHLWGQTYGRYSKLQDQERMLSSQAGQLLNALQREEAVANKLSTCVRKIRHTRKKLLARIQNPRWEVRHHYHMTCLEHVLGHTQPHVMEVGEMVPGHLRLFSFARRSTLFQKSIVFSLTRAKNARNSFSDKIKEVYRELRVTRADLKEVEKLLDAIKEKSHLMGNRLPGPGAPTRGLGPAMGGPSRGGLGLGRGSMDPGMAGRAIDPRMRYLHSLNISPTHTLPAIEKKRMPSQGEVKEGAGGNAEVNMEDEWRKVGKLLKDLEFQAELKVSAAQELVFLEQCRSRFKLGIDGLPQPLSFAPGDHSDFIEDALETLPASSSSLSNSVVSTVPDKLSTSPPSSPRNPEAANLPKDGDLGEGASRELEEEPHGDLHIHSHSSSRSSSGAGSAFSEATSIRRKASDVGPRRSSRAVTDLDARDREADRLLALASGTEPMPKSESVRQNKPDVFGGSNATAGQMANGVVRSVSSGNLPSASSTSSGNNKPSIHSESKGEMESNMNPSTGSLKSLGKGASPISAILQDHEPSPRKSRGRRDEADEGDNEEVRARNIANKPRPGTPPLGITPRNGAGASAGVGLPGSSAAGVGSGADAGFGSRRPQAQPAKLSSRAR